MVAPNPENPGTTNPSQSSSLLQGQGPETNLFPVDSTPAPRIGLPLEPGAPRKSPSVSSRTKPNFASRLEQIRNASTAPKQQTLNRSTLAGRFPSTTLGPRGSAKTGTNVTVTGENLNEALRGRTLGDPNGVKFNFSSSNSKVNSSSSSSGTILNLANATPAAIKRFNETNHSPTLFSTLTPDSHADKVLEITRLELEKKKLTEERLRLSRALEKEQDKVLETRREKLEQEALAEAARKVKKEKDGEIQRLKEQISTLISQNSQLSASTTANQAPAPTTTTTTNPPNISEEVKVLIAELAKVIGESVNKNTKGSRKSSKRKASKSSNENNDSSEENESDESGLETNARGPHPELGGVRYSFAVGPLFISELQALEREFTLRGVTGYSKKWPLLAGKLTGLALQKYLFIDKSKPATPKDCKKSYQAWIQELEGVHAISTASAAVTTMLRLKLILSAPKKFNSNFAAVQWVSSSIITLLSSEDIDNEEETGSATTDQSRVSLTSSPNTSADARQLIGDLKAWLPNDFRNFYTSHHIGEASPINTWMTIAEEYASSWLTDGKGPTELKRLEREFRVYLEKYEGGELSLDSKDTSTNNSDKNNSNIKDKSLRNPDGECRWCGNKHPSGESKCYFSDSQDYGRTEFAYKAIKEKGLKVNQSKALWRPKQMPPRDRSITGHNQAPFNAGKGGEKGKDGGGKGKGGGKNKDNNNNSNFNSNSKNNSNSNGKDASRPFNKPQWDCATCGTQSAIDRQSCRACDKNGGKGGKGKESKGGQGKGNSKGKYNNYDTGGGDDWNDWGSDWGNDWGQNQQASNPSSQNHNQQSVIPGTAFPGLPVGATVNIPSTTILPGKSHSTFQNFNRKKHEVSMWQEFQRFREYSSRAQDWDWDTLECTEAGARVVHAPAYIGQEGGQFSVGFNSTGITNNIDQSRVIKCLDDSGSGGWALPLHLAPLCVLSRTFETPETHGTCAPGAGVTIHGDGIARIQFENQPRIIYIHCAIGDFGETLVPGVLLVKESAFEFRSGFHKLIDLKTGHTSDTIDEGVRNSVLVRFLPPEETNSSSYHSYSHPKFQKYPNHSDSDAIWHFNHVRRFHIPKNAEKCSACRAGLIQNDPRKGSAVLESVVEQVDADRLKETGEKLVSYADFRHVAETREKVDFEYGGKTEKEVTVFISWDTLGGKKVAKAILSKIGWYADLKYGESEEKLLGHEKPVEVVVNGEVFDPDNFNSNATITRVVATGTNRVVGADQSGKYDPDPVDASVILTTLIDYWSRCGLAVGTVARTGGFLKGLKAWGESFAAYKISNYYPDLAPEATKEKSLLNYLADRNISLIIARPYRHSHGLVEAITGIAQTAATVSMLDTFKIGNNATCTPPSLTMRALQHFHWVQNRVREVTRGETTHTPVGWQGLPKKEEELVDRLVPFGSPVSVLKQKLSWGLKTADKASSNKLAHGLWVGFSANHMHEIYQFNEKNVGTHVLSTCVRLLGDPVSKIETVNAPTVEKLIQDKDYPVEGPEFQILGQEELLEELGKIRKPRGRPKAKAKGISQARVDDLVEESDGESETTSNASTESKSSGDTNTESKSSGDTSSDSESSANSNDSKNSPRSQAFRANAEAKITPKSRSKAASKAKAKAKANARSAATKNRSKAKTTAKPKFRSKSHSQNSGGAAKLLKQRELGAEEGFLWDGEEALSFEEAQERLGTGEIKYSTCKVTFGRTTFAFLKAQGEEFDESKATKDEKIQSILKSFNANSTKNSKNSEDPDPNHSPWTEKRPQFVSNLELRTNYTPSVGSPNLPSGHYCGVDPKGSEVSFYVHRGKVWGDFQVALSGVEISIDSTRPNDSDDELETETSEPDPSWIGIDKTDGKGQYSYSEIASRYGVEAMQIAFQKEEAKHEAATALTTPTKEYYKNYVQRGNLIVPIFSVWAIKVKSSCGTKVEVRNRWALCWNQVQKDPLQGEFVGRVPSGSTPSMSEIRHSLQSQNQTNTKLSAWDEPKAFLYRSFRPENEGCSTTTGNMKLFGKEMPLVRIVNPVTKLEQTRELRTNVNGVRSGPNNHEIERDWDFHSCLCSRSSVSDAVKVGCYLVQQKAEVVLWDIKGIERGRDYWDSRYLVGGRTLLTGENVDFYDVSLDITNNRNSNFFQNIFRLLKRGYNLDTYLIETANKLGLDLYIDFNDVYVHQERPLTEEEKFFEPEPPLYPFSRFRSYIVSHVDDYLIRESRWLKSFELMQFNARIAPRLLEMTLTCRTLIRYGDRKFVLVSQDYVGVELHHSEAFEDEEGKIWDPIPFSTMSQLVYQSKVVRTILTRPVKTKSDPLPVDIDEILFRYLLDDPLYVENSDPYHARLKFQNSGLLQYLANVNLHLLKTISKFSTLPATPLSTWTAEQIAGWLSRHFLVHCLTPCLLYDNERKAYRSLLQTFTDGSFTSRSDTSAVTMLDGSVVECVRAHIGPTPASVPEVELYATTDGYRQHAYFKKFYSGIGYLAFGQRASGGIEVEAEDEKEIGIGVGGIKYLTDDILSNDNNTALAILKAGGLTKKSRSIQSNCLFLKDHIRANLSSNRRFLHKVPGLVNPANLNTKLLTGTTILKEAKLLGMIEIEVKKPVTSLQESHDLIVENFEKLLKSPLERAPAPSCYTKEIAYHYSQFPY